jgi:hypothetical protein
MDEMSTGSANDQQIVSGNDARRQRELQQPALMTRRRSTCKRATRRRLGKRIEEHAAMGVIVSQAMATRHSHAVREAPQL